MIARLSESASPDWTSPDRAGLPEKYSWLSAALRVVGVPAMALTWWAVAFLPWTRAPFTWDLRSWLPTVPVLLTDLEVAVFGPVGASIVVVALMRRRGLAFLSVMLGLALSIAVTMIRGADVRGNVSSSSEQLLMFFVCVLAASAGLAIGAIAIRSLRAFGFLGQLALAPVASLIAVLLLDSRADSRWLTSAALSVLMVMIAWRRWSGVLLWPIFFVLFWLLTLLTRAVGYGAGTMRHPGGSQATVGTVADAMISFLRSAWQVMLELHWQTFWPAAVIAALVIGGQLVWRRARADDA